MEVFYRRIVSAKKWVNPGFMKGPWIPLYGFGVVLMFSICIILYKIWPNLFYNPLGSIYGIEGVKGPSFYDLIPILIMGLFMNLLEFIAGIIFVKGFKVKLWDYSNMRGNILGIICPVFMVIWVLLSVVFYYLVNPFLYEAVSAMYIYMFGDETGAHVAHFGVIFSLGIIYGVLIIDFIKSLDIFTKISHAAKQSGVIEVYEKVRNEYGNRIKELKSKLKLPKVKKLETPKIDALKEKVIDVIYIDKNKIDSSDNYDENGRPKKE